MSRRRLGGCEEVPLPLACPLLHNLAEETLPIAGAGLAYEARLRRHGGRRQKKLSCWQRKRSAVESFSLSASSSQPTPGDRSRSMPVLACPHCAKQLRLLDSHLGRLIRCPGCQGTFQVPLPDAEASAPPPWRSASPAALPFSLELDNASPLAREPRPVIPLEPERPRPPVDLDQRRPFGRAAREDDDDYRLARRRAGMKMRKTPLKLPLADPLGPAPLEFPGPTHPGSCFRRPPPSGSGHLRSVLQVRQSLHGRTWQIRPTPFPLRNGKRSGPTKVASASR